ncbi:MAG: tetratricopeptide repeat protein [Bacteroidota bacterium]
MKNVLFLGLTCFCFSLFAQSPNASQNTQNTYLNAQKAQQKGDLAMAKGYYLQAIADAPDYIPPYRDLARLYRDNAQLDSSILLYQSLLEKNPRDLQTHQDLAAAFMMEARYHDAITQYKALLKHYPDFPAAFYGIAMAYFNLEQYSDAVLNSELAMRMYLSSKSNLNAADARMLAGKSYLELNNFDKAIKYFKASKKHFQGKPYFPFYLGLAYLGKGDKDKARQYFGQAEALGYNIPSNYSQQLK